MSLNNCNTIIIFRGAYIVVSLALVSGEVATNASVMCIFREFYKLIMA